MNNAQNCNTISEVQTACLIGLPVELVSFTGKNEGTVNVLEWITASEINSDYFIIERSTDGINFHDVGKVKSKSYAHEVNEYQFKDEVPKDGINYYRLRPTDLDGTYSYSGIISLVLTVPDQVSLYPNPSSDQIFIRSNGNSEFKISDITGQVIIKSTTDHLVHSINIQQLPQGMYTFYMNDQVIRFIKQ
jgi:Secretion system C-terminal sorting domain